MQFASSLKNQQVSYEPYELSAGPVMGHVTHILLRFITQILFFAPAQQRAGVIGKRIQCRGRFPTVPQPQMRVTIERAGIVPYSLRVPAGSIDQPLALIRIKHG